MDIANQAREDMKLNSPRIACENQKASEYSLPIKNGIKRSFDVAFLMLPDEKLKNKRTEKHPYLSTNALVTYPSQISVKSDESLRELSIVSEHRPIVSIGNGHRFLNRSPQFERSNNNNESAKSLKFNIQNRLPRIYDDPAIIPQMPPSRERDQDTPRSAFTKVPHNRHQESPNPPPMSPDRSMSCPSASPPVSISPPRNVIYQNFRPDYQFMNSTPFHTISQIQQAAQTHKFKQQLMYQRHMQSHSHNDVMPTGYMHAPGGFPSFGVNNHPFASQPELPGIVRNPAAAALFTTLIPPTIATTFSLTAQNVCAKCNISFRMTSDLVYHMRSHHKSEYVTENQRRKREDKLKCPVCNESFRERHHLTRHMTAHQDKESDEAATIELNRRQNK